MNALGNCQQCGEMRPCVCPTARDRQVGGTHYTSQAIQPWDVIDTWPLAERIGWYRGNLLKYTMRMHDKDAPADNVGKAEHYAAKLREVLGEVTTPVPTCPVTRQPCEWSPTCKDEGGIVFSAECMRV